MFSRFFIDRPIFASVLSIVVTLAGSLAVWTLPVAQYPDITPPTVEVSAVYPGANAVTVADTVAAPVEQQVNGVEGMMYMSSQCTNDGAYTLTVTFKVGTDLNIAQVLVQNRVSLAQPVLPELVRRRGIQVKKKSPSILQIVNLYSPDGSRDALYLSNYATIQLRDELSRLPGIGDITYLGQRDYSMRLWLDPERMAVRGITAADIMRAVEQQNVQVAAGQVGQPPVPGGQVFQYTMTALGRLADPEQFADVVLKTDASGRLVRLRDVAQIELGALGYDQACTLDGRPSVALSVYQLPGSNALDVAGSVRQKMEDLKRNFPRGLDYAIVYDTTPFITESIREVFKTLRDAVLLVSLVVLVFLQNWRSAIIPLVAVPVAVVGTFAFMAAVGFSLNTLTLFGLVLAIGIVVDDAIVVVEAVEHHIEGGLSPYDATVRALREVSGPVVAVGLVLAAVFVPCAFIGGIVGLFFRQFAVTIAVSTLLSAFNSLTLSPALCAILLKPKDARAAQVPMPRLAYLILGAWAGAELAARWMHPLPGAVVGGVVLVLAAPLMNRILAWAFRGFNRGFARATERYTAAVGRLLGVTVPVLLAYGGLVWLTGFSFQRTPTGFIPQQDKGYVLVNVQLPDSASVSRTERVMAAVERVAGRSPGVRHTVAIAGQSLLLGANAANFGSLYVMLDDFAERDARGLTGDAIAERLRAELQKEVPEGLIDLFAAPPVEGLGTVGGFKLVVEDRGDNGLPALEAAARRVADAAAEDKLLRGLSTSFRAATPWLYLDIDRQEAKSMGVSIADVFNALQVFFGSYYVNDFNKYGRTWQVNLQAGPSFRKQAEDVKQLKVRNDRGGMVPLGALASIREVTGPAMVVRYNMYPAAAVNGDAAPGTSSGEAIDRLMAAARRDLPPTMRAQWTELAFLQLAAGNTAMLAFVLAVVLVFLVLAAQYESWSLPLAVILVVPMCLLSAVAGVQLAGLDINIFTQVGFVVLVGLACKNAILIVEFAKQRRDAGVGRRAATLEAVRLRLRPIVMTSLAFILGVVPLMMAGGAGYEMRRTLGVAVFAGMLGVTLFGLVLTPVFFYAIQAVSDRWTARRAV